MKLTICFGLHDFAEHEMVNWWSS